jgi:hypothetical protein
LIFSAAGHLWEQRDGAQPRRLSEGEAIEDSPAISPDGRQLAYLHRQYAVDELRVLDLATGQRRTVFSGQTHPGLTWSPDGKKIVFSDRERQIVALDPATGQQEVLARITGSGPTPRPHFSRDGRTLYYAGNVPGSGPGAVFRVALGSGAQPEILTELQHPLFSALVSPDGQSIVIDRNQGLWVAPLKNGVIREADLRPFSDEGGGEYSFTPDGREVIYAVGGEVWRKSLAGGEPAAVPMRLRIQSPVPPTVVLQRVRVLDFAAGGFGPETSLLIENGRIKAIGANLDRSLAPGARVVDGEGRFAIPGLFDMHTHGERVNLEALLAYGVTSARDTGGPLAHLNSVADRGDANSGPVPRYFYTGELFEGPRGHGGIAMWHIYPYSEEVARKQVRRLKARGAHFIKLHPPTSWDMFLPAAEEARRVALPIVSDVRDYFPAEGVVKSVVRGVSTIEHSLGAQRTYDDVLQLMAAAGTRWVPTSFLSYGDYVAAAEPERLRDPRLRAFTPDLYLRESQQGTGSVIGGDPTARGNAVHHMAQLLDAHRRGVTLLAGTDSPSGPDVPLLGAALHWEIEYFVRAGLTPLEALKTATVNAATAVGVGRDLGTLEVGKLADIVVLDANPLENIRSTESIRHVLKGGWVVDLDKLKVPSPSGQSER